MNPAESSPHVTDVNKFPLVRIDAQEEAFVQPLREYLEANDCSVVVNSPTADSVTYFIAAGDVNFVKDIFSTHLPRAVRRLGIVVGSSLSDSQKLVTDTVKIIVVDPVYLMDQDVQEIFSFFFSENEQLLDKRRSSHEPSSAQGKPFIPSVTLSQDTREHEDVKRIKDLVAEVFNTKNSHHKNYRLKKIVITFTTIMILLLAPVFWYAVSLTSAGICYGLAARELNRGNTSRTERFDRFGDYWLTQGKISFAVIKTPMMVVGLKESVRNQERLVSFMGDISVLYRQIMFIVDRGRDVASILLAAHNDTPQGSPAAALTQLQVSVSNLVASFGLAQAQLEMILTNNTFPFSFRWMHEVGRDAYQKIETARSAFVMLDHLLVLYPRIAGFDKPATYVVLLQNSNELRPTGGFIGSIGTISFDTGFMRDFVIQDVYAVDGQLKGHVDPPAPIRELLAQEHWYLRDSNWDPDFRVSGQKAAWFYQKETGETIDGVIAINLPLVVDLLRVTGPITLSDYNDRITQENFFGKSLFYTQENFFPGSTQKSDFLGSLSRSILESLTTKGAAEPLLLFQAISNGLNRKDLMFYFNNPELEELSVQYQWAGKMFAQTGCSGQTNDACIRAAVGIIDANLSVSKVNYFIKRSSVRELTLDASGSLSETIALTVHNTAADNAQGIGGSYLSYLRFYIPDDVSIEEVRLDDTPVNSRDMTKQNIPPFPYIEREIRLDGIQVIAVVTQVPPGEKQITTIHYTYNRVFNMNNQRVVLDILQDKQGGVSDMEETLRIHVPVFWKAFALVDANRMGKPILAKNSQLEYNTTLSRNQLIRVIFSQ